MSCSFCISISNYDTEFIAEQTTGPAVDKMALKQLTDMGFPEDKATKALKLNR